MPLFLCLDKLVKLGKGKKYMQKAHGKIKTCIEVMYSLAFNPFVGIIYEGVLCINSYILTYILSPMVLKGKLRYYMLKVGQIRSTTYVFVN